MSIHLPSSPTEAARHRQLQQYGILDTEREEAYDDLAALAAYICKVPIAAITFFDGERQWFKSAVGADIREAPMEFSFCTYVAADPQTPFVVEDATLDVRFAQAPHVVAGPQLRAYAGTAVVSPEGVPLGSICVFDVAARSFDEAQLAALRSLSRQVVSQLELRKRVEELEATTEELRTINEDLDQFGYIVGHDLKAPIRQQSAFAELILEDFADLPAGARDMLEQCRLAGHRAARVLEDIDKYLHDGTLQAADREPVRLDRVIASLPTLVIVPAGAKVEFEVDECAGLMVPAAPMRHVLANLIANAIKYNDKPEPVIRVLAKAYPRKLRICVVDNGPGIPEHDRKRIFQIFGRGANATEEDGRGLGLAICVKLLRGLGGQLSVSNGPGGGAEFCVTLPR